MSINRDLAKAIGAAVAGGKITSSGLLNTPAAVTSYAYDSAGPLLAADSSGYDDGSLHYLSKLREVYVWDDSDGGFFKVDKLSDDPLSGGGGSSSYQGTQYGYSTGGGAGSPELNTVDKFPFASDGNAADVGDYVENAKTGAGSSSSTAGYVSGGFTSASAYLKGINKRLFASDASESNIGDLDLGEHHGVYRNMGNTSSTDGYHSGGISPIADYRKAINKISFSSDGNGTNIGDLTTTNASYVGKGQAAGISSPTDGYVVGGSNPAIPEFTAIDKFPFAADGNATNIGDLPRGVRNHASHNSSTHGYTAGGTTNTGPLSPPGMLNVIEKFAFASDTTTAGDVGDLTAGRYGPAGTSSTSSGYTAGGHYPAPSVGFIIDKFPFAADGNATDVGDLTVARSKFAPTQV